ncbi:hypothetical protein [Streptomyces zagrosensis]|uniref:Uncharacterized protein n=1 Tax=Streptomyces zagrosensis TaxID=1042984 RepID=A0A7W9Q768_9ACTN|nr:hypothetical protein [Streptomyces zagrosensis]MBB5934629.1 hypothetical protein [Streptomyces zagrosensis]
MRQSTSRLNPLWNFRERLFPAIAALLLIGTGIWWATTDHSSHDEAVKVPNKVCLGRVSGAVVADLLPQKGESFKEETESFEVIHKRGYCELTAGGEDVNLSYLYIPGYIYPRDVMQKSGVPVSLGDAYGYMSSSHAILLYVPCVKIKPSDRMLIVAGSSLTRRSELSISDQDAQPTEHDDKLAAFVATAARELARGPLHCSGADKLPEGPVKIHWK